MDRLEKTLYEVDFSQYTDLKERLAARLFGQAQKTSPKVVQFPGRFTRIEDDDLEMVNAAQGLRPVPGNPFQMEEDSKK